MISTKTIAIPAKTLTLPKNPTTLDKPAFLMNVPLSYGAGTANNAWMVDLSEDEREVDDRRAMRQFLELYHLVSAEGVVFLLPTPVGCRLQDLVFTANLGIVLEHLPDKNTVVLSNYAAEGRQGETAVGEGFFRSMGYETHVAPHLFEGEAELKHLHDNVYVGGYGLRSDLETFDWMERTFDMRIIRVRETEPYLYHLDTTIFPITREATLVCTDLYEESEIDELEQHTDIIDVSTDVCMSGLTNSVRLYNTILNASNIHEMKAGTQEYADEVAKNRCLEDIAVELGFEVTYVNLSEYLKGGALLSCMMMHLNRRSYDCRLL